jgi:hypothetical protein
MEYAPRLLAGILAVILLCCLMLLFLVVDMLIERIRSRSESR